MEILATVAYGQFRDEGLTTPAGEPRKLLAEYRAIRSAQLAIARERGLSESDVRAIISAHTEGRQFGFLGEPRVNVLELNLELDTKKPMKNTGR